jgi:hypothetical protein
MSKQNRDLWSLFTLALLIRLLAIVPVQQPGYMDAAYSYDIALNLAQGQGLVEPFLWNYLDNPAGLPHPSHLYWMPLPTILAWLGLTLLGQTYQAAQVPFAALSALLPPVSYWVAVQTTGSRRHGWLAGLLTLFSGFYLLYWGHTDNFTPFTLTGSLSLIAAWQASRLRQAELGARGWGLGAGGWALIAGALAGLAHLSRADGPLLLIAIGISSIKYQIPNIKYQTVIRHLSSIVRHLSFVFLGYALVMLPWFARNWMVVGALLPATGAKTIWLTTYDDLFSFGRELSPQTYLAWGWRNILRSKGDALWLNIQTVVAVLCMVFLVPLVPIGWWRLRRHQLYQLAAWYGVLLFLAMTFVFTFPGPRGGLFHSGGALLPFIFTTALVGLDAVVEWAAARRRGWDVRVAKQVFGIGLVGLALLVSGFLYYRGAIAGARWKGNNSAYSRVVAWLDSQEETEAVVMVGDPPGYWYHGGGPSIVVPNEPVETVLVVADRYGARYLVLDHNRPAPLTSLYEGTGTHPRLHLTETLSGNLRIYLIQPPEVSR